MPDTPTTDLAGVSRDGCFVKFLREAVAIKTKKVLEVQKYPTVMWFSDLPGAYRRLISPDDGAVARGRPALVESCARPGTRAARPARALPPVAERRGPRVPSHCARHQRGCTGTWTLTVIPSRCPSLARRARLGKPTSLRSGRHGHTAWPLYGRCAR